MGFSSQAISVKSSINLSDINIDSDLDMGANSIIGYEPTTNNDLLYLKLSDYGNLLDGNNAYIKKYSGYEYDNSETTDEFQQTIAPTTYTDIPNLLYTATKNVYVCCKFRGQFKSQNATTSIRLYKNTTAIGTEKSTPSSTYTTVTDNVSTDFALEIGDTISVRMKCSNASYPSWCNTGSQLEIIERFEYVPVDLTVTFTI